MANSDSRVFYTSFQFIYDRIILVSVPTAFTAVLCTGVVSLSLEAKIKNVQAHWKLWIECAAWDDFSTRRLPGYWPFQSHAHLKRRTSLARHFPQKLRHGLPNGTVRALRPETRVIGTAGPREQPEQFPRVLRPPRST